MSGLCHLHWRRQRDRSARRGPRLSIRRPAAARGFTLIEMMVAVGLTILMMTMVVTVFGLVMDSIRGSRAAVEVNDRLRAAKNRLQLDLEGLTAPLTPPLDPAMNLGYFELIEGPIGPVVPQILAAASDTPDPADASKVLPDTTVGDLDDVLMFTAVSNGEPFVGRMPVFAYSGGALTNVGYRTIQSRFAEVCWFVRGNVLHRRTLLIYTPSDGTVFPTLGQLTTYFAASSDPRKSLWDFCDLSLHVEGDPTVPADLQLAPNTLGDLTKRENRYAHQPFAWPHDARFWAGLGLPTLEECTAGRLSYDQMTAKASVADPLGRPLFIPRNYQEVDFTLLGEAASAPFCAPRVDLPGFFAFDAWRRPHPSGAQDPVTGQITLLGTRVGEDVILTNVINFDVKVWDPGAPIVTLNDTTNSNYPNGEGITPGDGGIVSIDGRLKPAGVTCLERLNEPNGGSDLDTIVGYGAYVDLNYLCRMGPGYVPPLDPNTPALTLTTDGTNQPMTSNLVLVGPTDPNPPRPQFHHAGDLRSGLFGTTPKTEFSSPPMALNELFELMRPSVYDTYSTHYESDGINQSQVLWNTAPLANADAGANGLDDNGNGAVDESTSWPTVVGGEKETAPPYPHALRGIQIKIRVFEPDTRQVREVTLEHEFLPQ